MAERKFVNPDERPADAVEKALLKRALGFTHKEVQTEGEGDKRAQTDEHRSHGILCRRSAAYFTFVSV